MTQIRKVVYTHSFESPVGMLYAAVDRRGRVFYLGFRAPRRLPPDLETRENKYACGELEGQLAEYFAGERHAFTLDLRLDGTNFQRAVWSRLAKVEYGRTASYGHIAQKIGRREAARAVGNAVAANPVAVLIPCHRIVPAGGGLGNYALRGIEAEEGRRIKQSLLELEAANASPISSRTPA